MLKVLSCFILVMLTMASTANANDGGFSLSKTRVIFNAEEKEANIDVINSSNDSSFLMQSWLTDYNSNVKDKPPFIITPPLYRQDKGKNTLRVIRSKDNLPKDRESAFWLNAKAIPAQAKDSKNALTLAYVLKVKMFYRPAGLEGNASTAYKKLSFGQRKGEIIVKNTTPYFITLTELNVSGKDVKDLSMMVPPFGEQRYKSPDINSKSKVMYKTINDFGGITSVESREITF